ncbi:MAG TPA: hypothetical protein VIW29_05020 [Polyangiaceae bacterium]
MTKGFAVLSLLAQAAACTRTGESVRATAGAPALGEGGASGTAAGGASGAAPVLLGDLLPVALRLDCSAMGDAEPPSELYLRIAEPHLQTGTLTARLEGALCAEHDVAAQANAPAAALRCPPRQLVRSDSYPAGCSDHYIELSLCSPGFTERRLVLQNLGPCSNDVKRAPSCSDVAAGVVSGYAYEQVIYELEPLAAGGADCPSFSERPKVALADEALYACPCSSAGE